MREMLHVASDVAAAIKADQPVVALESTGGTLSADQKAMREAWLGSKRKQDH